MEDGLDISESGRQIGEKLLAILNSIQKEESERYIYEQIKSYSGEIDSSSPIFMEYDMQNSMQSLTEVQKGELYFCLEKLILNHVSNLRKKLRISDAVPDYIKSIRGVGYKFDGN